MEISYDRTAMELSIEFVRNANPVAERFTPDEIRDFMENDMRLCIKEGRSSISRYGYLVNRDFVYGECGFQITVDLAVFLPCTIATVWTQGTQGTV